MSAAFQRARAEARALRGNIAPRDSPAGLSASPDDALQAAFADAELRLRPRKPGDALLSGAHAVLDREAETVWYRDDVPDSERRLILAHELGHVHLHHHDDDCRCDDGDLEEDPGALAAGYGPRQRREAEANVFAREFLLPAEDAQKLFAEGADAPSIAKDLGLPLSLVYSQLSQRVPVTPSPNNREPANSPVTGGQGATPPGLDHSQAAAAYAAKGPLLVGAGPGTGKTRTLTARVLHLLTEKKVAPENILCLTFSRKAADEMRERIGAEAPDAAARLAISTFHAFGLDLLRRRWREAGLPPRPVLLTEAEGLALLEKRVGGVELDALRYLHDPAFPLPDVLRAISKRKEERDTPAALDERAAGEPKWTDVGALWRVYDGLLVEKGALDFADLVARPLNLLEENPAILAAERAQWKHVLVDEYQDINRSGARLVQLLTGEGAGLWAVGDLRQAIYAFRGASPANVTQFQTDFPRGERTDLAVNYRSKPALVALFGVASGEGPRTWEPKREGLSSATLAIADDDEAQADGISRRMQKYVREGMTWADQVVLCRTRNQAKALRKALSERGIPVATGGEGGLLSDPSVRKLVALLDRIAHPSGPATKVWPELPAGLERAGKDAYALLTEALWGPPRLAATRETNAAVESLLGLAQGFRERSAILLEENENPLTGFLDHLRRLARLGVTLGDHDEDPGDVVRVLTVHASKGLEFPVVFVPNLSVGRFPPRPAPGLLPPTPTDSPKPGGHGAEAPIEIEEEARLFFVALTRARDHLILSRARRYGRFTAQPTPLLDAIENAPGLREFRWERSSAITPSPNNGEPNSPIIGGEGVTLAITAADAELYLRCPRRYAYERVENLSSGPPSAYDAFKRATLAVLRREKDLADAWDELGPPADHPHAPLYRNAADKILRLPSLALRREGRSESGVRGESLTVSLPSGATLTIAPDALAPDGTLERHTFRKPPDDDAEEAPNERVLSLLHEAIEQNELPASVAVRYLQNDAVRPAPPRPRSRKNHLEQYDRAVEGIQLRVFPAQPDDFSACPACPFFFVCPD